MRKTILISCFVAVVAAMAPTQGRAACCGEAAAIAAAASSIDAAIAAQTAVIAGAIAQSGNAIKKAQVDSAGKAADQAAQDAAALSNEQAQQRATEMFQVPPDGCKSVANSASLIRTREVAGQVAKQISREQSKKFQGGDRANPKLDASVGQQLATIKHQEKYCTAEEAARGLCSQARNGFDGADLLSDSLLRGAGPVGGAASAPLSFTPDQLEAAKAYLNNVVTLTPPAILTKVEDEKTPQGRVYLGARNARQAQISLAALPFNAAIADRTPQTGLTARARQIWQEMQEGHIEPPPGYNPGAGDISPAMLRQLEVDRRAGNPSWHVEVAAAMPDAVAKEQTYILALMASQQQQILQRLEELTLIVAAQFSEQTKAQDPALLAKYNAAVGSGNRH